MKRVVTTNLFGPMLESLGWCKIIIEPAQTEQSKQNHKQLHSSQHNTLREKITYVTRAGIDLQEYLTVLQVLLFNRTYFAWNKNQKFTWSTIIANMKSSTLGSPAFRTLMESNCSWLLHVTTATCKGWKWSSMKSKVRKLVLESSSLFILYYSTRLGYSWCSKHSRAKGISSVCVRFCIIIRIIKCLTHQNIFFYTASWGNLLSKYLLIYKWSSNKMVA